MFILFLFFFLFSSHASSEARPSENYLESTIIPFMKKKSIPGMAIAVSTKAEEHLYEFGFADIKRQRKVTSHTLFEIASITKVFTSTALALEVLRGKMDLDAPVTHYLPNITHPKGIKRVTLEDLATHTSSLPRVPPIKNNRYNSTSLMHFLEKWQPSYPIGSKYVYSNLAFGVLGYALETIEKKPYEAVIQHLITGPLQMRDTKIMIEKALMSRYAQGYKENGASSDPYPLNAWPGGGALRSTSRDMLKFLKANLGKGGPKELLNAMQFAQKGFYRVNKQLVMGLGWQRFRKNNLLIIDKNGGVPGFSSYIGMLPKKKIGIVILANKGKVQVTQLGRALLIHLANEQGND